MQERPHLSGRGLRGVVYSSDAANIVTDRRGRRLRIGFGLYHTAEEVDRLLDRLASL